MSECWANVYFLLVRPMLKWCIRLVTGKCELLRITYEERETVERVKRIENSLRHSKHFELKDCVTNSDLDVSESIQKIVAIKNIVQEVHTQFETKLAECLFRIRAYSKILVDTENLRKTIFSTADQAHEAKLTQLWYVYNRETSLPGRVGPHWTEMGFQGHDPSTDFRGMGMLGLEQLIYFASKYPAQASHILSQSHHPQYGFSFAIVGINITAMGYNLLTKKKLRSHFYGLEKLEPDIKDFHQMYCHLLYEFVQFWIAEKPKDIMEFSRVRDKFHKKVKGSLKEPRVRLLSAFQKESS